MMKRTIRLGFAAGALIASATVPALQAAAEPPAQANRLEATFTESAAQVTNRIADLGIFQLINTGIGSVDGFGQATVVVAISQDRSVRPCGADSWTNAATRRIVLAQGILVLREMSARCPTAAGPDLTGTYEVDGASSTGIFTGARGSGEIAVNIADHASRLSGKLKLAGSDDS